MTDDRWNIKGRDDDVLRRFKDAKAEYNRQRDENVTDERALALLLEGVPIKGEADTDAILERLDGLEDAVAQRVVEAMQEARY